MWLLQPVWLAIYPPHAFWVTDPANSAQRCVVVMVVLLALSTVEARAPASFRASAPVRFVELFGTSSLAAYFWHEMLLYYQVRGISLAGVAGGKCGWLGYALLTAAVIATTAVLAARHRSCLPLAGWLTAPVSPSRTDGRARRLSSLPRSRAKARPAGLSGPAPCRTASTTSTSVGKPFMPFLATTLPSTATSKMPPLPGMRSDSIPRVCFSSAAARVARGRYPQTLQ